MLEMKIARQEDIVANSRIIDESKIDTSKVQILNRVTIQNQNSKQTIEYTIVSQSEADVKSGKISVETPIAKGLLGKKVGDVVSIVVPSGQMSFKIMDISL